MRRLFLYGLFMDMDALRGKRLHPKPLGPAMLPGYQIRIGNRATLVANPQSASYGLVVDLPEQEVHALYSETGVCDYIAEEVSVILLGDRSARTALCYNLPPEKSGAEVNSAYAAQLSALLLRLGFPADYANEVIRKGTV